MESGARERERYRAPEPVGATVHSVNHTGVISIEGLEELISDARRLASEDASDRLPVVVADEDLVDELELARAAGRSGSSPAVLERELLAEAYRLSHGLNIAVSTCDAYVSDWADLVTFLTTHRLPAQLPVHHGLVVLYLTCLAHHGTLMATIDRRIAAIRFIHEQARAVGRLDEDALSPTEHPMVRRTRRNLARRLGTAPENRRKALYTDDMRRIVNELPSSLIGQRDTALLLIGFAGGFRRSKLVGIDVEDIEERTSGIAIHLPKSQTDQHGRGRTVGILTGDHPETCPVTALRAWIEAAQLVEGPVFRAVDRHGNISHDRLTAGSVARIVKRTAQRAGLDPDVLAGHSLRSGHATTAASRGASDRDIMRQTGHRSRRTLDRYIQDGRLLDDDNSSGKLGL